MSGYLLCLLIRMASVQARLIRMTGDLLIK